MPGMNPVTGRWARDGEENVIAVRRAFSTPKGSRVLRRYLGCDQAGALDRPLSPIMLGPTTRAFAESLLYEPRVRLVRLGLDAATRDGATQIAANIRVVADATNRTVTL